MASWQPCLFAGDLNVEPAWVPYLQKGIMAGHLFDLQASWAAAAGPDSAPTCKQVFGASSGSRRDFFLGCPLASASLRYGVASCNWAG